jgi:hypothetical protein
MKQAVAIAQNNFINMYLSPDLIGDTDFTGWRLHIKDEKEIKALPFTPAFKAHYKAELKKSKLGIAIDNLGGAMVIKKKGQIIESKTACMRSMGFGKA